MQTNSRFLASALVLVFSSTPFALADQAPDSEVEKDEIVLPTGEAEAADLGPGPLSGPRWGRPPLTGEWFGVRRTLAEHGLTFGIDIVNVWQSVLDGGFDRETKNGGSIYLETHFDTEQAGFWPGGFLDFRLEKSYGKSINEDTGTALGANMVGLFPDGDDKTAVISKLMFTQFVAEWLGFYIGRFDTADGDANHFAAGRGRTQFMNPRLTFSPQSALTTPYVLNGIGALVVTPNPLMKRPAVFNLTFADPQVQPDESGLNHDFFDEQYVAFEYHVPTRFFAMPGSQNVGFNWSSKDFIALGDLKNIVTTGAKPDTKNAWVISYNFHQYVYVRDGEDIDNEGYDANTPLLRGFGIFGRLAGANSDANPSEFYAALGLGGRGLGDRRPNDEYGVAAFITTISNDLDVPTVGLHDETWGFEMYYRIEIMPFLHISPDFQVLGPLVSSVDPTVVLGLRTKVDL